ncbi:MAG: tripartite tricarboxylate transporter permease [Alphaproteobacteria bacterium]|nr:tripartite tricarboxylate transporter permease [Alphaproteobacteria bacterium]
MDLLTNLALGFGVAVSPANLLFCLIGALVGTLIGVLPGIGPLATIAMLLPLTYHLEPVTALIMLAGIYYGAQYGSSTTAILVNLPGETSSVVTTLDGHQMARNGRAGAALAVAALGSFFAGSVATLIIAVASPPLARLGLQFQAPEYFALMTVGLVGAIVLAHGSVLSAVAVTVLGLFLGLIGTDLNSGRERFTLGFPELADGVGFVVIAMGLFGVADILVNLERDHAPRMAAVIGRLWPTREEFRESWPAAVRGTFLGSLVGVLPGGSAALASFAAYALEKKVARDPSRFGKGAIAGVAGPESANNAASQASFIPTLTLGIPANALMALMMGAMQIFGVTPSPRIISEQPAFFWGIVCSMWIGNVMLLIINLPLIGIWVQLLRLPYRLLHPIILLLCCIGVYSLNASSFDVVLMLIFGVLGYLLLKFGCEPAPLLLGFVLGPLMEENLRRALLVSRGDPWVFVERPISAGLLALSALLLVAVLLPALRARREEALREE